MSLIDKLIKNSTLKNVDLVSKSELFGTKELFRTDIPMMNVAFSGDLEGGFGPGITMLAGPSKHFKSAFALMMAGTFLRKKPDGVILFYDSEFGTPKSYFDSFKVLTDRVIHCPIMDVEELKIDVRKQLELLVREDDVLIVVDSIGNLASKKESQDALAGDLKADVGGRAKALKSFFRIVTPHLNMKNIPMVVVNHTYDTMEMYSKKVVSGGTGGYYSAENIWILGRRTEKEEKEVTGYHFIINIEKSRLVKENSKIPITVMFGSGIQKYSGLLDICLDAGIIVKDGRGFVFDGKKYKSEEIENNDVFWENVLALPALKTYVRNKYQLVPTEPASPPEKPSKKAKT